MLRQAERLALKESLAERLTKLKAHEEILFEQSQTNYNNLKRICTDHPHQYAKQGHALPPWYWICQYLCTSILISTTRKTKITSRTLLIKADVCF